MRIDNVDQFVEGMFSVYLNTEDSHNKGRVVPSLGTVYLASKGNQKYLTRGRNVKFWQLQKPVVVPNEMVIDWLLGSKWFEYVYQIEANFGEVYPKEVILKSNLSDDGRAAWKIGFGFEDLAKKLDLQISETEDDYGKEHMYLGDLEIASSCEGGWMLNALGLKQDPEFTGNLMDAALKVLNTSLESDKNWNHGSVDFLNGKTSWLTTKEPLRFNFLVTRRVKIKDNYVPFMDVVFDRMGIPTEKRKVISIRFPQDMLAEALNGSDTYTVMAYPDKYSNDNKDMPEDDGIMFLKNHFHLNLGESNLGVALMLNEKDMIIPGKGRVVFNAAVAMVNPDANPDCIEGAGAMHTTAIDGWCRVGFFKYMNVKPGIYTIRLGSKKEEAAESERVGGTISTTALTVGRLIEESADRLYGELVLSTIELGEKSLSTIADKAISKIMTGKKTSIDSEMLRYQLGLGATTWNDEANTSWLRPFFKKAFRVQSKDVARVPVWVTDHVAYAQANVDADGKPVITAVYRTINTNEILGSDVLVNRILGYKDSSKLTIMRDPVFTKTSYLGVDLNSQSVDGFGKTSFVIIPAICGPDLGADCDDFIKILVGYVSTVRPGTVAAIVKHIDELSIERINKLSAGAIYMWASWASGSIGQYVNCLHEAINYGGDPNSGDVMEIAQCCQALVQAPKKPVKPSKSFNWCRSVVESVKNSYQEDDKQRLASRWSIMKGSENPMKKSIAIADYYRVDVSTVLEQEKVRIDAKVSDKARADLRTLFREFFEEGSDTHVATFNRRLFETLVLVHGVNLNSDELTVENFIPMIKDYYAFVMSLSDIRSGKSKISGVINWKIDSAIKSIAGAALWMGRTSFMSIDTLFLESFEEMSKGSFYEFDNDFDEEDVHA